MTREEARRENARRLANLIGGKAEFGRLLVMEPSQVSQIIGPKPTKNIGNSIARRIELAFKMQPGSLDNAAPEIHTANGVADPTDVRDAVGPQGAARIGGRDDVGAEATSGWLQNGAQDVAPRDLGTPGTLADALKLTTETPDELRMLSIYRLSGKRGRLLINQAVNSAGEDIDLSGAVNKGK